MCASEMPAHTSPFAASACTHPRPVPAARWRPSVTARVCRRRRASHFGEAGTTNPVAGDPVQGRGARQATDAVRRSRFRWSHGGDGHPGGERAPGYRDAGLGQPRRLAGQLDDEHDCDHVSAPDNGSGDRAQRIHPGADGFAHHDDGTAHNDDAPAGDDDHSTRRHLRWDVEVGTQGPVDRNLRCSTGSPKMTAVLAPEAR